MWAIMFAILSGVAPQCSAAAFEGREGEGRSWMQFPATVTSSTTNAARAAANGLAISCTRLPILRSGTLPQKKRSYLMGMNQRDIILFLLSHWSDVES